jgi:tRNA threonylcarbamoyladenosine biosynthesis protein TsaB
MALILNIETATKVCSVAIGEGGKVIAEAEMRGQQSHAGNLTLLIEQCLKVIGRTMQDLDAIAVSHGPGSYTGLRIGLSTAKGICYALEKPLITVKTLAALASVTAARFSDENAVYCPMIDARRMEVYTAIFDENGKQLKETQPLIVENEDYFEDYFINNQTVIFSGDGSEKCKTIINHKNAKFIIQENTAVGMVTIAERQFNESDFDDLAYSSPFYLKSPNITKPRKKL